MAVISTGSFAKFLWPGVNAMFMNEYAQYPTEYDKIYKTYTSTQAFEEDVATSAFGPAVVKDEGASITFASMKQTFVQRYTMVEYGLGFIVTSNMIKDNQYKSRLRFGTSNLAFSLKTTKERVGTNKLNRAFNNAYTYSDGLELCSELHLTGQGGTYANEPSTSADLSESALEQGCIDIAKFTDPAGSPIAVSPQTLIIHPNDEFEAGRILKSTLQSDSAYNNLNILRATGKFPGGYHINHYLTDTDAWFIITNCPNGMKLFQRDPLVFGQDDEWDTKNIKYGATERYEFGCSDPHGIYGCPGV